ncbi:MAG: hypothetical protein EXS58_10795 [Candidatus Latescibacteria bacterium]|nr:hypothetical protein [Candidatus Latescibacterota bacterium]
MGRALSLALVLALWWGTGAGAQPDYGNRLGRHVADRSLYSAVGTAIQIRSLDPTVQRWYLPQELFQEYGRRQWRYTNYAKEYYRRYLEHSQEGSYLYDFYGDLVTRGWLIYNWRQTQPLSFESSAITKDGRYVSWFNRLILSSDASGDYSYTIMVGDEINTTLTPMTFRKAGFNGVATSLATSRVRSTALFSRVTLPIINVDAEVPTVSVENATNLSAGRVEADVNDFLTLGLTMVNAHNVNGSRESFRDNPFKGLLTSGQLERSLNLLVLRLSDDSPEDAEGGAVLFSEEVEITTSLRRQMQVGDSLQVVLRDTVITGSSLGFRGVREGGRLRKGFLTADGPESITLKYILSPESGVGEEGTLRLRLQQGLGLTLSEAEDAISAIRNVRFRLVLANDYRVEVASDRQTNPVGQPQFLVVSRAPGNIKNHLNQREVVFDYGLPTANQIYGMTAEVRDFRGFDFYGEFDINTQYRKYPTTIAKKHRSIAGIGGDRRSVGWMANISRRSGPWRFFLEGFGMDERYTTTILPVDGRGVSDYSPEATSRLYDLVDDNDDNDRHPDQQRIFQGSLIPIPGQDFKIHPEGVADPAVFPGYDENGDFISDFNQNSNGDRENFFPDYEEPFLRYSSDRPEFLFGIDLNNNGWVDRFENDDLPDYPYRKDHWGHNLYASVQVLPEIELTAGQLSQELHAANRQNHTRYGIFSFERDWPTLGRVRVYEMLKKAEDNISDELSQWLIPETRFGQPGETSGRNQPVPDPLAGENTWINTLYGDWEYHSPHWWSMRHRFKWETWRQREAKVQLQRDDQGQVLRDAQGEALVAFDPLGPEERYGRETSGFLGLIDKADYLFSWRQLSFQPRVKSEWLSQVPFSRSLAKRRSWDELFCLLVQFQFFKDSNIQLGFEQRQFFELLADEKELAAGRPTGDFRGTVLAFQLTNTRPYLGYSLTTQLGIRYDRRSLEVMGREREDRTSGLAFLSVFAGL